jgi:hypothetical protein
MLFGLFKKKPKPWREFVGYIDPFFQKETIAMQIIQKANDLGLQGKKVKVLCRTNRFDTNIDQIWFEGE